MDEAPSISANACGPKEGEPHYQEWVDANWTLVCPHRIRSMDYNNEGNRKILLGDPAHTFPLFDPCTSGKWPVPRNGPRRTGAGEAARETKVSDDRVLCGGSSTS